ncbi:MAG: endo-1,4-beta-xylanase, partial [Verrucomicrobiota bacterium]
LHFKQQGYDTIGLGKIYHGTNGVAVDKRNWSRWLSQEAPEYVNPESKEALKEALKKGTKGAKVRGPTTESADVPDNTYADGKRAERAAQVLGELAGKKKPFFFAVGFNKPHLPCVAPKKYWDLYQRDEFKMPDNKGIPPGYPEYAANLPAYEMRSYCDYVGEMPTDFPEEMNQRLLHGYAACVSYTDANLGVMLDALDKHGLADNTIVVLWGDHGWKLGDHSSWCKHTNFECDTRVPLLMRVPGMTDGTPTSRLVELIDLYPTLCELTGLPTPMHCQGRSFKKLLGDAEAGHRNSAYSSYPARKEMGHSIRFGNFRYTEWFDETGKTTNQRVLTNLKADPGETTNSVDDPEFAEHVKRAQELLKERMESAVMDRSAPQAELKPLKEAVNGRFKLGVGTDHGIAHRKHDSALLQQHFDIITPENCMKWSALQPEEGKWNFEKADAFVDYAEANGIEMVGHCLVWSRPGTTPEWVFKDGDQPASRELMEQRLKTHIETVVGRYKGRLSMWDVVNEALADRDDEYLRDNPWCNVIGEDFIVQAFQHARAADPDAFLIYNDYRCDHPGKLKKLERLISSVKEKGGPIDALGLQAHYEYGMIPYEGIESAMNSMRDIGVKIVFSELDMDVVTRARWYHDGGKYREEMASFNPYPGKAPFDILRNQADQYDRLFALICKNSDVVERVTFWNLHDAQSWLNYWPWDRENHPLLFDRNRQAKPAYYSVLKQLESR